MKQVLTIVVKLQLTPKQVAKLEASLQAFADACNFVNENTDSKLTNKIAIQSLVYQTIKEKFNLGKDSGQTLWRLGAFGFAH